MPRRPSNIAERIQLQMDASGAGEELGKRDGRTKYFAEVWHYPSLVNLNVNILLGL